MSKPLDRLKHHVTGAIERGEKTAIESVTNEGGVMKAKHTPGPWVIETYHGSLFKICKPDFQPGDEVAHRLEADARLIAAAPELLACLVDLLDADGDLDVMDFDRYRDVLAKATGCSIETFIESSESEGAE